MPKYLNIIYKEINIMYLMHRCQTRTAEIWGGVQIESYTHITNLHNFFEHL